LNNSFVTHVLG